MQTPLMIKCKQFFITSLKSLAKGRIAYLLKHSRPKAFERKESRKYHANLENLKQPPRQKSNAPNVYNRRNEEEKREESDEMNIDSNPSSLMQKEHGHHICKEVFSQ